MAKHKAPNNTPEQTPSPLDEAMVVIDVKAWIALATILLVVVATLIWAFFGTMHVREDVSGVLVKSGRVIHLYANEDSTLLDLSIDRGHYVEGDQVIARVEQPDLVNEIIAMIAEGRPEPEIELARKTLLERSQILTYDAGRVEDIYVHPGDHISRSTRLATIVQNPQEGASLQCLLFVPVTQMHNLQKGMHVNVYPDFASKNQYGGMYGTISHISDHPVTFSYLYDVLGSEELAREYTDTAHYEIAVNLVTSEDTPTGYQWTTSNGPAREIGNLSLCQASIVIDELRPLDVFFHINI